MKSIHKILHIYIILMLVGLSPIIDVKASSQNTNKLTLKLIKEINTGGDAFDVKFDKEKEIAIVSCGYQGVKLYNISNPKSPILLSTIGESTLSTSESYAHQIQFWNNLIFVGDGYGGLKIINITNPIEPVIVCQTNEYYSWDIQVNLEKNLLFLGSGFFGMHNGLIVYNITSLDKPVEIMKSNTLGGCTDLEIMDNQIFITEGAKGMIIYNINENGTLQEISKYRTSIPTDASLTDIELGNGFAAISIWGSALEIVNITNLSNVSKIISLPAYSHAFSSTLKDDLLYICDIDMGLFILNINNSSNPVEIGSYTKNLHPCWVDFIDNLLYLTDQNRGLLIFEIKESKLNSISSMGISIFLISFLVGVTFLVFRNLLRIKHKQWEL